MRNRCAGNSANSASVTVTVNNGAPTGTPGQLQWVRDMSSYFTLASSSIATDHSNNVVVAGNFDPNGGANFALYPGAGIEAFAGPIGIRLEAGDDIYFLNGARNNLKVSVGPVIRF